MMTNHAEDRLNKLGKGTTDEAVVEIAVILDASGSMQKLRKETIDNYNKFLWEQKTQPGKANISLTTFSNSYNNVYSNMPLNEAPELTEATYNPDGWTALYDAVSSVVGNVTARNPKYAIIVIITDGEENYSRWANKYTVGSHITNAQNRGWRVVYLGANQDSFKEAGTVGISPLYTKNFAFNSAGLQGAANYASASTMSYRDSAASGQMGTTINDIVNQVTSK